MKITDIIIHLIKLPTRRDHLWASKMETPIGHHAILELMTDEGITGWGEAPAGGTWGGAYGRNYGETPETVQHLALNHLLPAIRGFDPLDIGAIHTQMDKALKGHPYAKAAIDVACHDAAGKALGIPIYQLLGGMHREGLEVTHSLGIMDLNACYSEAETAVAEGARTIKCKTGLEPDRDVELVRRLREQLGDSIKIRVDANEAYGSVSQAVNVTRRQEEYAILLCEQPLMGARNLARVARRISCPVMADESAWDVHDIIELNEFDAAESFSCYVTKPGGLHRARKQAEIANDLGMICDIGGSIETAIGNAANLHLGVSLPNAVLPSVCPVSKPESSSGPSVAGIYYLDDLNTEAFTFKDGQVHVPTGPGLGIEVDREKIEKYRV